MEGPAVSFPRQEASLLIKAKQKLPKANLDKSDSQSSLRDSIWREAFVMARYEQKKKGKP